MERRRAEARQKEHGGTAPGKAKTLPATSPEVIDAGDTRDKVGEALGVSGGPTSAGLRLEFSR